MLRQVGGDRAGAAVRIAQLTDARDGGPRPATDGVDAALIEPIAAIGTTLEGTCPYLFNRSDLFLVSAMPLWRIRF